MAAKIVRALIGIWIIFLIGYFGFKFYQKHKAQIGVAPAGVTGESGKTKGFSLPFSLPGMKNPKQKLRLCKHPLHRFLKNRFCRRCARLN